MDIRAFFGGPKAPKSKEAAASGAGGSASAAAAAAVVKPSPKAAKATAQAKAPAAVADDGNDSDAALVEIDAATFFGNAAKAQTGAGAAPKSAMPTKAPTPAKAAAQLGSAVKRERSTPALDEGLAPTPSKLARTAAAATPPIAPQPAAAKPAAVKPAAAKPAAAKPSASGSGGGSAAAPGWSSSQCLRGCTLVLTGEFAQIGSREAAEDLVKEHGGRVTAKVSANTTYLLRGHDHGDPSQLQAGSKVDDATERQVPMLGEAELLALLAAVKAGEPAPERMRDAWRKAAEADAKAAKAAAKKPSPLKAAAGSAAAVSSGAGAAKSAAAAAAAAPGSGAAGKRPAAAPGGPPPRPVLEPSSLWADRYAPDSFDQLIGNQAAAKRLCDWLRDYARGKPERKAALLSGPPGIGKTTAAKLATKLAGLDAVEFNASDVRSKSAIKHFTSAMSDNHTLLDFARASGSAGGAAQAPPQARGRLAVIMDEVDGMGGGDRGGMAELISMIKGARVPVICICNDRQDQKVRSLANYCVDIRFQRPPARTIATRMAAIAAKEGVPMEPAALEKIAEVARADIRQVLNVLQMWRPPTAQAGAPATSARPLGFAEVKARLGSADKDVAVNVFDVAPRFFTPGTLSVDDRLRLYFADDLVPLFVQENYISAKPGRIQSGNELAHLNVLAAAANTISEGDLVATAVMRKQRWELAPFLGIMSAVAPGFLMSGGLSGGQARFPGWLGKNSTATKNWRLGRDLHSHMMAHTTAGKLQTLLCYLPALHYALTQPLAKNGGAGIDEVVEVMMAYGLDRDDFDAVNSFLDLLAPKGTDGMAVGERGGVPSRAFESLDKATKAAFTRRYNEKRPGEAHKTGKRVATGMEARGGGDVDDNEDAPAKDEAAGVDEAAAGGDDDDDDDIKNDRLVKAKTRKAPAASAAAKAKRASGEGASAPAAKKARK